MPVMRGTKGRTFESPGLHRIDAIDQGIARHLAPVQIESAVPTTTAPEWPDVSGAAPLALAREVTRDYLVHHRLCPKVLDSDGTLVIAGTSDACLDGVDDLGYAYRAPVRYEVVERSELEQLIERLTTRAERSLELARIDTNNDDL